VAATGLSVAATARRRPKTPGGDRAEKGLTGRSAWPRRSPREGAAGVAVVPRPHRGGRELPECRLAAGLNAVVATGLTVAAKAGQTGQPRRPPAVQEGAFPGPETGRWEARSSPRGVPGRWPEGPAGPEGHESQGEKPTLTGGHPYPPPPADTSAGVFCLPLKPPGRPLEGRGRGGGLLPLGPRGGGLLGPLEAGRGGPGELRGRKRQAQDRLPQKPPPLHHPQDQDQAPGGGEEVGPPGHEAHHKGPHREAAPAPPSMAHQILMLESNS
jgi:hypothetical protein